MPSTDIRSRLNSNGDREYYLKSTGASLFTITPTGLTLAAAEIVTADIADLGVTTAKIAAAAVTAAKLSTTLKTSTARLNITDLRVIDSNDIPASASNGGNLSSNTTPVLKRVNGATDKALVVSWAATVVDEVQFPPIIMPPDIDETVDITIHLLAKMSGATDTPVIDVQVFDGIGDTEMGGNTGALSATLAELTVTIANANVAGHATGFLNVALVPAAHGDDALDLYGAWIEYTRK